MRLLQALLLVTLATDASASWSIRVTTSGGFAGIGRGGVSVASDGKVEAGKAALPGHVPRSCEYQLSAEELTGMDAAVAGSKPEGWAAAGLKAAAPDAFR